MKIGDQIHYAEEHHASGFWKHGQIYGETSRSWLVLGIGADEYLQENLDRYAQKIPKTGKGFRFVTAEEAALDEWATRNRYHISKAVEMCRDATKIKQIAEIIDYKSSEPSGPPGRGANENQI